MKRLIFVTKYRYQVLVGEIGLKVRKLIRQTCHVFEIEILKGVVSKDHVYRVSRNGGANEARN